MTPSTDINNTPPWIVPHPRELPESDVDLVYNLPVIKTPAAAIPPREFSERMDEELARCEVKELRFLVLRYVTVSDDWLPRLAVFLGRYDDLGGAVEHQLILTLLGYADWMPKTTRAIRYPVRHGFPFRCPHAYRDHWYHGTSDHRCHVNDKGEHWVKNCPGQAQHETSTTDNDDLMSHGRI